MATFGGNGASVAMTHAPPVVLTPLLPAGPPPPPPLLNPLMPDAPMNAPTAVPTVELPAAWPDDVAAEWMSGFVGPQ